VSFLNERCSWGCWHGIAGILVALGGVSRGDLGDHVGSDLLVVSGGLSVVLLGLVVVLLVLLLCFVMFVVGL